MTAKTSDKNESERLFEEYLELHGYSGWDYEPEIPGQLKCPDYRLPWRDKEFLLEVKELREKDEPPGKFVPIDPCRSLRSAINAARAQFKALKEYCCSLVVYNKSDWQTILDPPTVFGSMLGDPGFTWKVEFPAEETVSTIPSGTFLDGGKMIDPKSGRTQNTTISSIVVLKRLPRVSVFENPFARIPLCRTLFTGPYDERWALTRDVERVFVGEKLKKLEEVDSKT